MFGKSQAEKRARARRKLALGLPRREARELDSFVRTSLAAQVPGYSRSLLGRALAEFALRSRPMTGAFLGPLIFIFLIPVQLLAVAWWGGAGWADFIFLIAAYFFASLLFAAVASAWQDRASQRRPMRRIFSKARFLEWDKARKSGQRTIVAVVGVLGALVVAFAFLVDRGDLLALSVRALAGFAWGALLIFFGSLFWRYLLVRTAPQTMLVRLLASACGTGMLASPAQWRSARYRRTVATPLGGAATIVEGPILHILAAIQVRRGTPEWQQVRNSASDLRRLAARIVTGGPDSWDDSRRSVALALATAVAGTLVGAASDSPPEEEPAIASRVGTALHVARNFVIALLPAIGVAAIIIGGDRYGWEWAREARPLLIQFAIVSVLIGLMSVLDPSGYQQRLNAITGAGGSLFGRRG